MADAEESPSSLADLEALAGLGNATEKGPDEVAADEQSFDLAGLVASTASASAGSEAATDDQTLDLSGLAASSLSASPSEPELKPVGGDLEPSVAPSVPPTRVAGPPARSSFGFAYGMIAGVAVAGALFLAMREGPPEAIPEAAPSIASKEHSVRVSAPPSATALAPVAPATSSPQAAALTAGKVATKVATPTQATGVAVPPDPSSPRPNTGRGTSRLSPATANVGDEVVPSDPTMPPRPEPLPPTASARETATGAMDSLLDDALGSRKATKQIKAQAGDNLMGEELPSTPSAADVTKAVQLLLPAIRGCAMGQSGVANTLLVVRGDGTVANAVITGAPYAGAASGRCMEGVLRRARFGRFQQSTFRVQFPLSIRATP